MKKWLIENGLWLLCFIMIAAVVVLDIVAPAKDVMVYHIRLWAWAAIAVFVVILTARTNDKVNKDVDDRKIERPDDEP